MKKSIVMTNPVTKLLKKSLLDLPTPTSISMLWNMGFMLGLTLTMQIMTGLFVSMTYTADVNLSFSVMIMIMRDINMGWITRMIHMNGASLFFVLLYIHTARGIYFSSPANQKKVWLTGMIIMLLTMMTAFLGYVLPWGQMSFWGATVITGVMSAIPTIGQDLVVWVWGGPSVSQPTLNRFFSLHFMMPMVIMLIMMIHLMMLHEKGSSMPTNILSNTDKMKFNPMFTLKDMLPTMLTMTLLTMMALNLPNLLGDVENFNPANPLITPVHIQPEWYFLFAYVILRSVPSKLGGVLALVASILILAMPMNKKNKTSKFSTTQKMKFWMLVTTVIVLTWIGTKSVEKPYETIGQIYTIFYFYMMMLM